MRILTDIRTYNPSVLFLLENVEMGKKWERVLSEAIGIFGVHINSALVSAQSRPRIYWTNIRTKNVGLFDELHSDIPQPQDRRVFLRDIVEDEVDRKYYLGEKLLRCLKRHGEKRASPVRLLEGDGKSHCLLATAQAKCSSDANYICMAMRGRKTCQAPPRTAYGKTMRKVYDCDKSPGSHKNTQQFEPRTDGKTNCLTGVQKDNLVWIAPENGYMRGGTRESKAYPKKRATIRDLCISCGNIRRLTPTECARLQTIPEWYVWKCSDTQQYRMLGNGWTVEVIAHIFSFLNDSIRKNENKNIN